MNTDESTSSREDINNMSSRVSVVESVDRLDAEIKDDIDQASTNSDGTIEYMKEMQDPGDGTQETVVNNKTLKFANNTLPCNNDIGECNTSQRDDTVLEESNSDDIPCMICGASFPDQKSLDSHNEICRSNQSVGKPYSCGKCHKAFAVKSYLAAHIKRHNEERPLKCDVCGKGFVKQSELNVHMRIHNGMKPYQCDVCGVAFQMNCNLTRHMRKHTGELPFQCNICQKLFTEMYYMKRHQLTAHSERDEMKFTHLCDYCGKGFSERNILDQHIRVHTGAKPYQCDFCGKTFRFPSAFSNHRKLHLEDRPYICETCGKCFVCQSALSRHGLSHLEKTFICVICDMSFSTQYQLQRHIKSHNDKALHMCDICGAELSSAHRLRYHVKSKHNETDNDNNSFTGPDNKTVYPCSICNKVYKNLGNLKKHSQKHCITQSLDV